jgi:hypothetical protein
VIICCLFVCLLEGLSEMRAFFLFTYLKNYKSIAEQTEKERRAKQAETQSVTMKQNLSDNLLTHRSEPKPERVTQKLAETFKTPRFAVLKM